MPTSPVSAATEFRSTVPDLRDVPLDRCGAPPRRRPPAPVAAQRQGLVPSFNSSI